MSRRPAGVFHEFLANTYVTVTERRGSCTRDPLGVDPGSQMGATLNVVNGTVVNQ